MSAPLTYRVSYAVGTSEHDEQHYVLRNVTADKLALAITRIIRRGGQVVGVARMESEPTRPTDNQS